MIRIAHEAPKEIFKTVQNKTDYDYCLVHLCEEDKDYFHLFVNALIEGREVILDNSIFELEEAFDAEKFAKWVDMLNPTYYIIPDALEDSINTQLQALNWKQKIQPKLTATSKSIGVVQGKSYDEIVACYQFLDQEVNVDCIAISFDYSYYQELVPHPNKLVSWMLGRVALLGMLDRDKVINRNKPHHLLGSALPQEGLFYQNNGIHVYPWLSSMDTSNPIVHTIKHIAYRENQGLWTKDSQKLFELINYPATQINELLLNFNVREFRKYWNGN